MAAGAVLLAVGFLPLFAFSFILGNDIKFLLPASAQALNLLQNDYFLPAALALGRVRRYRPAHAAVVPMTLVNSGYFQEIIGSLRDDDIAVHHFTLLAEPATVRRRLGRRSLGLERKQGSWAANHLSEHLQRLRAPQFAQHIHTDQQTIAQVADAIASSAGLAITPSTDGPLRASLRRYATTIRHIRFD